MKMRSRLAKKIAREHIALRHPHYSGRSAADFLGDRSVARNTGYGEHLHAGPGNAFEDEIVAEDFLSDDLEGSEIIDDLDDEIIDDLDRMGDFLSDDLEGDFLSDDLEGDFLSDDLEGDFLSDDLEGFEIIDDEIIDDLDDLDRMGDFWKESRLPSHKHNDKKTVETAWKKHKENNPEMEKYEGAMTPDGLDESKVEENSNKSADDEIIDDIGLGRRASSSLVRDRKRQRAMRRRR
jgi:hypothetical protein